jgi:hypothetical protein
MLLKRIILENSMLLQRVLIAAISAVAGFALCSAPLHAQTLDKSKERSIVVVGTKAVASRLT